MPLDPFAASLSAIDKLLKPSSASKRKRYSSIENVRFQVALSFPGERRPYVAEVASRLQDALGKGAVFYDNYYQAELARANLDILLQLIYNSNSDLIAVFLCEQYDKKEWCGLEWRSIRDIIKQKRDKKIMLLRFDNAAIPGLFSIDGYIDIAKLLPIETAQAIVSRLQGSRTDSPKM